MKKLSWLSAEDRRITAYTKTFVIKPLPYDTVQVGIDSYDCWGNQQGGTYKFTTTPEYAEKQIGWKNFVTIELMQRGCCAVIKQELAEVAEEGAD